MSIQEIIVAVIVIASVVYTLYNVIKLFTPNKEQSCGCASCDFKTKIDELKSLSENLK